VGHEQFNKLLSAINIPTISTKTMKLAEERVGPVVVALADESCKEAIAEEKELTVRKLRLVILKLFSIFCSLSSQTAVIRSRVAINVNNFLSMSDFLCISCCGCTLEI